MRADVETYTILHRLPQPTDGPCAKVVVTCTLVMPDGARVVGTNYCRNPQDVCPRVPGEDYIKCRTICDQPGHAEIIALSRAAWNARGAHAYVEGNTYLCRPCQEALFGAGVVAVSIGAPPPLIA